MNTPDLNPGTSYGDEIPPARGDSAATPGTQLQRLVLEAPYGPATANIDADPDNLQVTYKIATDTCGLILTVEPEHGDGRHAIPYGADLHLVCNGIRDTVTVAAVAIAAITHGRETVTFPAGLLPDAGIDRHLLAAVIRAVLRDWADRPDTHRQQRRAAARTAAARLPHAQQLLTEYQADLAGLLTELDNQHHTVHDLRALAADHSGAHPHDPGTSNPGADDPGADISPPLEAREHGRAGDIGGPLSEEEGQR